MNWNTTLPKLEAFIVGGKEFFPISGYNHWSPNAIDIPMFLHADGTWDAPFNTVVASNPEFPRSWFDQCFLYNPKTGGSFQTERRSINQSELDQGYQWVTVADLVAPKSDTGTAINSAQLADLQAELSKARARRDELSAIIVGAYKQAFPET